jgi:hypothetical protein
MNKTFNVDYFFKRKGAGGRGSRTQAQGSSMINLGTSTSDFAVVEMLKRRHQDCEIEIMSIRWN